jgi:hypothetical protein
MPLEDMGGRCGMCDRLICWRCVKTGKCDPFEEQLKRYEHKHELRKWY